MSQTLAKGRRGRPPVDLTGQRFRMLTALYPTSKRDRNNTVVWHCRCDCGREVDVSYEDLVYSPIRSCGCQKRRAEQQLKTYLTHVAGTTVDRLKSTKPNSNSKTGVRGVFQVRGLYRAELRFQGKVYRLGTYKTLEEAAAARRRAEDSLYKPFVAFYQRWQARAQADPAWGGGQPHPGPGAVPRQGGVPADFVPGAGLINRLYRRRDTRRQKHTCFAETLY